MTDESIERKSEELEECSEEELFLKFLSHITHMELIQLFGLMTLMEVEINFIGDQMLEELIDNFISYPRDRKEKLINFLQYCEESEIDVRTEDSN